MPTYTGSLSVRANVSTGTTAWDTGVSPNDCSPVALGQLTDTLDCRLASALVIPATEVVVGVEIVVERYSVVSAGGADSLIRLIVGGSQSGANRSAGATWGTMYTDATFGGASDLWGASLTTTSFGTDFGVAIVGLATAGAATDFFVRDVDVTVYTVQPGDETPPFRYVSTVRVY